MKGNLVVDRDVYRAVYLDVFGAVDRAMPMDYGNTMIRAIWVAVNRAVDRAVDGAVYFDVEDAVKRAVNGPIPPHWDNWGGVV